MSDVWKRLFAIVLAGLALLLGATSAQALSPFGELCLTPTRSPGFCELAACVIDIVIECDGDACAATVDQLYRVRNRDRIKPAVLHLRRSPGPSAWSGVSLRSGEGDLPLDGASGANLGTDAPSGSDWSIVFAPDETRDFHFNYRYALGSDTVLRWSFDASQLAMWDTIGSLRIRVALPDAYRSDAILGVDPKGAMILADELVWDYEKLDVFARHQLAILHPAVWRRLVDLQTRNAHTELAELYLTLGRECRALGVPFEEPFDRALAEYLAAVAADPGDVAARLALADLYRSRGGDTTAEGMNYLLLTAEQLQEAHDRGADTPALARDLAAVYRRIGWRARELGDPLAGLHYLRLAAEIEDSDDVQDDARLAMMLQWAADTADKGMISEALAQLSVTGLPPEYRDALLRYAPLFSSARTYVTVAPETREVRLYITTYGPTASELDTRLQNVVDRWAEIPGVEASCTRPVTRTDEFEVRVGASYGSQRELDRIVTALGASEGEEQDALRALLMAPWGASAKAPLREVSPWSDAFRYRESVDLGEVARLWADESRFAHWRLVELRDAPSAGVGEKATLDHLAMLALREQDAVWQRIPAATYWVYELIWDESFHERPQAWVLSWGQARELVLETVHYEWPTLLRAVGLMGLGMIAFLLVSFERNRRRRRAS